MNSGNNTQEQPMMFVSYLNNSGHHSVAQHPYLNPTEITLSQEMEQSLASSQDIEAMDRLRSELEGELERVGTTMGHIEGLLDSHDKESKLVSTLEHLLGQRQDQSQSTGAGISPKPKDAN